MNPYSREHIDSIRSSQGVPPLTDEEALSADTALSKPGGVGEMADVEEAGQEHPYLAPWSDRIPAAIKKAEEKLGAPVKEGGFQGEMTMFIPRDHPEAAFTADEVALAKALWHELGPDMHPPALIAFTEKVEKLT